MRPRIRPRTAGRYAAGAADRPAWHFTCGRGQLDTGNRFL